MKLMIINTHAERNGAARIGVLLPGDRVGDLRSGYAQYLVKAKENANGEQIAAKSIPTDLVSFLRYGEEALAAARETAAFLSDLIAKDPSARGLKGQPLAWPLADCTLDAPFRPSKLIAVGRNYLSHTEAAGTKIDMQVPSAWIKANSAIAGPMSDVVKPNATKELDYETELSIVIGQRCKNVPESRAYDVIAGYTIVNDVSARDVARIERKEGNQLLGKMFDSFAPMGPWLVTADEIRDPMDLRLRTRVNGEIRQDASTREMIWPIPKLIAYISQMTLEPGDVITTGTPDGCAMGREPGEPSWFLKPGDLLESEVEGVGTMRNRIVAEPEGPRSWQW